MRIPKPDYTEDLPIFYRFGWGGGDTLRKAWEDAWAYVRNRQGESAEGSREENAVAVDTCRG
jgi:hypothetical protein